MLAWTVGLFIVSDIVGAAGVLSNALAIIVLIRGRNVAPASTLLLGLAVSDLGFLVSILYIVTTEIFRNSGYSTEIQEDPVQLPLLHLAVPFMTLFHKSGIYFILAVALDRYYAISKPFKYAKKNFSHKLMSFLILFFCLLVTIPRFFDPLITQAGSGGSSDCTGEHGTLSATNGDITNTTVLSLGVNSTTENATTVSYNDSVHPTSSCNGTSSGGGVGPVFWYDMLYVFGFTWVISYIIPMPMLIIYNALLIKLVTDANAKHSERCGLQTPGENAHSPRAVWNAITVISWFLLCQTPVLILDITRTYCTSCASDTTSLLMLSIMMVCSGLNSSVNFFIYLFFLHRFRRAAKQFLSCQKMEPVRQNDY